MDNFGIDTTQNVNVDYKMAGLFERMLAFLIDSIIIFAYMIVAIIIGIEEGGHWIILIVSTPALLYDFLFEVLANGQTPGKMVMKIRVMRIDGTTPSIVAYLLRWSIRLIEVLGTMGSVAVISIIVTKKAQRLGDLAAGTIIVKLENDYNINDTMLVNTEQQQPVLLPDVVMLDDDEINLIREVLRNTYKVDDNPDFAQKLEQLRAHFEEKLGRLEDLNTVQFLERIILDYNQMYEV